MYSRSWPPEVILNVPLSNPDDFPHPKEMLLVTNLIGLGVAVGIPGPDEFVGGVVGIPGPDEFVGVPGMDGTPVVQLPGRHWEYHSLPVLQHAPATHCVGPVHSFPPPIFRVSAVFLFRNKDYLAYIGHRGVVDPRQ